MSGEHEMSKDDYIQVMREIRTVAGDPSAHVETTVDPVHMEVVSMVRAHTGVDIDVQSTRHNIVYYVANEAGCVVFEFELEPFNADELAAALLLDFEEADEDMLEILEASGYKRE